MSGPQCEEICAGLHVQSYRYDPQTWTCECSNKTATEETDDNINNPEDEDSIAATDTVYGSGLQPESIAKVDR